MCNLRGFFKKHPYWKIGLLMSQIFTKEAEGAQGVAVDPTEPPDFLQGKKENNLPSEIVMGEKALSAIIISGGYRSAIINNMILKEGDSIGDDKIISIEPYRVKLKGETGETVLELFGKSIKEIPK